VKKFKEKAIKRALSKDGSKTKATLYKFLRSQKIWL